MKIRIEPVTPIEIDLPDYVFKAYDIEHFMMMLDAYIRDKMMSPEWYVVNPNDIADAKTAYKRRKKGLDRIEQVRGRDWASAVHRTALTTPDHLIKAILKGSNR